jgi:hypothetical protein
MAPDDYSTSSEEHQETRAPEAHPDYRNGVPQSASGILNPSYAHSLPRLGEHQTAPANTEGIVTQNRKG